MTERERVTGTWDLVTRSKFHSPQTTMADTKSDLGTCPFCGSSIPTGSVLLKYTVDGETRLFAECYECEEPVQPQ